MRFDEARERYARIDHLVAEGVGDPAKAKSLVAEIRKLLERIEFELVSQETHAKQMKPDDPLWAREVAALQKGRAALETVMSGLLDRYGY